jgi:hypothetical protein
LALAKYKSVSLENSMSLWGKEDKVSARPKSIKLKNDGSLAQDNSGKKLVYLSREEAKANANKGASGAGWYTVLKTGDRTRLELLIAISDEDRASINNAEFIEADLFNSNVLANGGAAPGIEDPNGRPGWYFKNDASGKKVNWYYFDGQAYNINLSDFSAYAVVTLDSTTSRPFLALYSKPTGAGDIIPGFARSSRVYTWPAGAVAGTKYLIYFGQNPNVHLDLPRVELTPGITRGPFLATEKVATVSLHSDSGSSVNNVQFVAHNLGINTNAVKADIELKLDVSNALEIQSDLD